MNVELLGIQWYYWIIVFIIMTITLSTGIIHKNPVIIIWGLIVSIIFLVFNPYLHTAYAGWYIHGWLSFMGFLSLIFTVMTGALLTQSLYNCIKHKSPVA